MDAHDEQLEACENLMNVVVESRKRFGKMCVEYKQKTLLMENKLLNLQLDTISNFNFKPKQAVLSNNAESVCKDIDEFAIEIMEKQKRIEKLRKNLRNTQEIVLQLKRDKFNSKLLMPLAANVMLQQAKNKKK